MSDIAVITVTSCKQVFVHNVNHLDYNVNQMINQIDLPSTQHVFGAAFIRSEFHSAEMSWSNLNEINSPFRACDRFVAEKTGKS